ncbi:saccharopine dehydrogenase-like NADP-dependent oxidoreductase [Micromonospora sp. HB375]|nr:saccharopine dehydrogenase-like NADP-dependent oxidoreductase [Micromonospora sp. HB375]
MRILLVGAGGVGSAAVSIAARRTFFELMVVADHDPARAARAVAGHGDRFVAATVDASSADAVAALCREHRITHVLNAVDPRFVMPIFDGAFAAGADYLDMAMSLSRPHPERPYAQTGVKLGDEQFAVAEQWAAAGRLALCGIGVEPGLSDVFARYAADELFAEIDEIGVRDGANLTVAGYDFAPSFSIWTTIEECLNPPVIWEAGRGWFTTEPFSEPEVFDFPAGSARSSASTSSTRRCCSSRAGSRRSGSPSSTASAPSSSRCCARCTSSGSTRPSRCAYAASTCRRATWWPPRCPTRPRSATG